MNVWKISPKICMMAIYNVTGNFGMDGHYTIFFDIENHDIKLLHRTGNFGHNLISFAETNNKFFENLNNFSDFAMQFLKNCIEERLSYIKISDYYWDLFAELSSTELALMALKTITNTKEF